MAAKRRKAKGYQGAADIACPFFRRVAPVMIVCEGVLPETGAQHTFASKRARDGQITVYCGKYYTKCEHYRAVMREKYGEDPDR